MQYCSKRLSIISIFCFSALLSLAHLPGSQVFAQSIEQNQSTDQFILQEAEAIYETNLARRAEGLAPLRWNGELSQAARWFADHAVNAYPDGHCGHDDLEYGSSGDRITAAGYTNAQAWSENVVCGYADPKASIEAWLKSPGHRKNLLNPDYREIGLGYYQRHEDGRGYIVQDLAYDKSYAPIIIENEALTTATPAVTLYIYNHEVTDGFGGLAPAKEMSISNEPTFANAQWEPFSNEKSWSLEPGEGWRAVYVKTRDALGRSTLVHDTIYLSADPAVMPSSENLTLDYLATRVKTIFGYDNVLQTQTSIENWSQIQFSSNWLADDSAPSFELLQGNGEWVGDKDAKGGQSFRLLADQPLSRAWMWSGNFLPAGAMVAYMRLKVANNQTGSAAIKAHIDIDGKVFGPLDLKGTDFTAPNQFQEFALPFEVADESSIIIIYLERLGDVDVYFDAATFYSAKQPLQAGVNWSHSNIQRSRTVWGRLSNESGGFSDSFELIFDPLTAVEPAIEISSTAPAVPSQAIIISDNSLEFAVPQNGEASANTTASITCENCQGSWSVTSDAEWLSAEQHDREITVQVNAAGLEPGDYKGFITVNPDEETTFNPTTIDVSMTVQADGPTGLSAKDITYLPVIKVAK